MSQARLFFFGLSLACAVYLVACAQASAPTGGPVDVDPPQPVSILPPPLTTYFSGNQFEIIFDEYVQVDDFGGQLLVSPPLNKPPQYKLRGKKLTVFWEERLLEETTYQVNLGESVKDFNEGNVNNGLIYVFSTGDYIDSLSLKGHVYDAATNEPVAGAKVMLYQQMEDSLPYTAPPAYLALTEADGSFNARYLPPDTFMIFILKEESSNYKYDGPPELIGFLEAPLPSTYMDSISDHVIPLFLEADTMQYLASTEGKDYGFFEVAFNIPAQEPAITFTDNESNRPLEFFSLLNVGRDTLRSWINLNDFQDLEEVTVVIKDGTAFADTTEWYIETDPKYRQKASMKITPAGKGGKINANAPISLGFNHPLEQVDTNLLVLYRDSVRIQPDSIRMTSYKRKVNVHYPFKPDQNYTLISNAGAFKDMYGNYSDSAGYKFGLHPADYYGVLKVKFLFDKPLERGRFIAYLKEGDRVMDTIKVREAKDVNFGKLPPGKYSLEGFFDENDNGQWDTGNFLKKEQPERRAFYSGEIDVRSSWDFEIDWMPSSPFDVKGEP